MVKNCNVNILCLNKVVLDLLIESLKWHHDIRDAERVCCWCSFFFILFYFILSFLFQCSVLLLCHLNGSV